jgi:hypothetical protein
MRPPISGGYIWERLVLSWQRYRTNLVASKVVENILESSEFFLTKLNVSSGFLEFLRTDIATLQRASFMDGRSQLSVDKNMYTVSLSEAMSWYEARGSAWNQSRLIFHVAFCGSTLLSRVLDTTGSVFVYKEPQVLTDLEVVKRQGGTFGPGGHAWEQVLGLVLSQFNSPVDAACARVIKPSNLMNSIVPDICGLSDNNRAVFLAMEPRSFLIAVLRGGSNRVSYIFRVLENLGATVPEIGRIVSNMNLEGEGELSLVARKILLAYALQMHIFSQATASLPNDRYYQLSYEQLVESPHEHVGKVSSYLDLQLNPQQISRNIDSTFELHSKVNDRRFDSRTAAEVSVQVSEHYGEVIDEALKWYWQLDFSEL